MVTLYYKRTNINDRKGITQMYSKVKNSKAVSEAEYMLAVFIDVYVMLILAYAALVMAGLLPAVSLSRKVLVVSLGLFAIVRLVVAVSRGHRKMVK